MKQNVTAPSVGESITEVSILKWHKKNGDFIKSGETLLEIESDKATVDVAAESSGVVEILKAEGERIPVGETIATIDTSAKAPAGKAASQPAASSTGPSINIGGKAISASNPPPAAPAATPAASSAAPAASTPQMGPAARKIAAERNIDPAQVSGTGKDGRVTKGDLSQHTPRPTPPASAPAASTPAQPQYKEKPGDRRVPMSMLRQRIAERLVHAQQTAAILTTFNEVDMSAVMAVRSQHKEPFKAKHGVNLSFMSFFTRACAEALKALPAVNASIDGRDVIYHDYQDIGIAVGTDRGLVVPVIRGAGDMGFVEIEKAIGAMAVKARDGKLSINDMTGGTFTISNGGTYGSLLSTPILNPPQSAILGMHKIQERPVAIDGKVEIRPMMYVALSYDHRLIDGKEAVTFLVTMKDFLENPAKLGLEY